VGPDGRPLVSPEVFVAINIHRAGDTLSMANVVARGVSDAAFAVRRGVRITEGRRFESGRSEVIVGQKLVGRVGHTAVGDTMRFAGRDWIVVGHFSAGGSSFESEIWGENEQFMPVFRGEVFQSVSFRLRDPRGFEEAKRSLESDQRIQVDAHREDRFYDSQSELLTRILRVLAYLITSIMAVGAIFGAVNTMYAAVAARTPEIAVLLTLGFKPRSVLASFLAESAVIAVVGGVVGCLLALPINGIVTSTTNWNSFTEVAFAFRITPGLLLSGMLFALVMGVLGGFFPARRAARLPVVEAIR
jgi:ABC-type lipoprotein release transport system permease subunit